MINETDNKKTISLKEGLFVLFNILANLFCLLGVLYIFFSSSNPRIGMALATISCFAIYFLTHFICKKWNLTYTVNPSGMITGHPFLGGREHKTHTGIVPLVFAIIYLSLLIGDYYTDFSYLEMVHQDFHSNR